MNKVYCDGKDNDFTTVAEVRIQTVYQGGQVDGHFLKFQEDDVISTASNMDKNIYFKIRSVGDDDEKYDLWIIIDSNSGTKVLAVKRDDDGTLSFTVKAVKKEIASIPSLSEIKDKFSDCLFRKVSIPGKNKFRLISYKTNNDGKSALLTVNNDGTLKTDHPPFVSESELDTSDPDEKHLFKMLLSRSR